MNRRSSIVRHTLVQAPWLAANMYGINLVHGIPPTRPVAQKLERQKAIKT
jgi:hypothetical protein